MKTKWTLALIILALCDSATTLWWFGEELHPVILWTISYFDWSLAEAMVYRLIYYIPFFYILDRTNYSKLMFWIYVGMYVINLVIQGVILFL